MNSIEVGERELGTIRVDKGDLLNAKAKEMLFNVKVMGRQKISSKEYKKAMKSQKNQSMSEISIFG